MQVYYLNYKHENVSRYIEVIRVLLALNDTDPV